MLLASLRALMDEWDEAMPTSAYWTTGGTTPRGKSEIGRGSMARRRPAAAAAALGRLGMIHFVTLPSLLGMMGWSLWVVVQPGLDRSMS